MRWDHLFDDLESQLEHELAAEEIDLIAEEERLRLGRLALRDRFGAILADHASDEPVRLMLVDGTRLDLTVGAVGRDWIAGEYPAGRPAASCIVPIAAVAAAFPDAVQTMASTRPPEAAGSAAGSLSARLGLGFVLRDLCRRRASLRIQTPREQVHGTIDRVARDHIDLAEHEPGAPRRQTAVRALRMMPLAQILLVQF
jgi:hypothetical protein